jgi:acyl dehydratase
VTTRYLEDIEVGDTDLLGEHLLTEEEIMGFARTWDPRPWHLDHEAAKDSVFGEVVACAAHLFALCSLLVLADPRPIALLAGLGGGGFTLESPGRIGDRVHLRRTFLDKRVSRSRPSTGILDQRSELVTSEGRRISVQEGALLIARHPDVVAHLG